MLAARLLLALALLAGASCNMQFQTTVYRGVKDVDLPTARVFHIPDGQCTATIYDKWVGCDAGVLAINVTVLDRGAPADVRVPDAGLPAAVWRRAGACAGVARVQLHAACKTPYLQLHNNALPPL